MDEALETSDETKIERSFNVSQKPFFDLNRS